MILAWNVEHARFSQGLQGSFFFERERTLHCMCEPHPPPPQNTRLEMTPRGGKTKHELWTTWQVEPTNPEWKDLSFLNCKRNKVFAPQSVLNTTPASPFPPRQSRMCHLWMVTDNTSHYKVRSLAWAVPFTLNFLSFQLSNFRSIPHVFPVKHHQVSVKIKQKKRKIKLLDNYFQYILNYYYFLIFLPCIITSCILKFSFFLGPAQLLKLGPYITSVVLMVGYY